MSVWSVQARTPSRRLHPGHRTHTRTARQTTAGSWPSRQRGDTTIPRNTKTLSCRMAEPEVTSHMDATSRRRLSASEHSFTLNRKVLFQQQRQTRFHCKLQHEFLLIFIHNQCIYIYLYRTFISLNFWPKIRFPSVTQLSLCLVLGSTTELITRLYTEKEPEGISNQIPSILKSFTES